MDLYDSDIKIKLIGADRKIGELKQSAFPKDAVSTA
jgi:hypothetical protein